MEVVGSQEGRRKEKEMPAFGPAPSTPPAVQPAVPGGVFGSGFEPGFAVGAFAAAAKTATLKRPAACVKPPGASEEPKVLYTSRQGGVPFGLAGTPGEQWAGSK